MYCIRTITAIVLSFILSNNLFGIDVSPIPEENNTIEEKSTTQPKKQRTLQESINASRAKWKPLPGSHFDENYHVVIDDPEVYQKALEKERSQNEGKFDYQNIEPQEDPREQNIFYRLYKHNPILGILATIPLVILAVFILRIRDSLRKKFQDFFGKKEE